MNALVEPSVSDALYGASQAGVTIELVIRGICCLRPGLPGVSENIRVISIVDKFLEHSRISYFENAGDPEVYLASADWMPRNFWRRIETVFPIVDAGLQARIVGDILQPVLADNVKARELLPDGTYRRRPRADGDPVMRSQVALQHLVPELDLRAASPYKRALETAEIIAHAYGQPRVERVPELAPGAGIDQVIGWLTGQSARNTVTIVGHEPDLSQLVCVLLTGSNGPFVELRKGAARPVDI